MMAEKDNLIDQLTLKVTELTKEKESVDRQRERQEIEFLKLKVRQLGEQIDVLKTSHREAIEKNQKFINGIIDDRIHFVQKLQIDLAQRDRDLAVINRKIKQLNFVIDIYKSQARQFNISRASVLRVEHLQS